MQDDEDEGPAVPIEGVEDQDVDTDAENVKTGTHTLFYELKQAITEFQAAADAPSLVENLAPRTDNQSDRAVCLSERGDLDLDSAEEGSFYHVHYQF